MNIRTRFGIGDTVLIIHDSDIKYLTIKEIQIDVVRDNPVIHYKLLLKESIDSIHENEFIHREEKNCFRSFSAIDDFFVEKNNLEEYLKW